MSRYIYQVTDTLNDTVSVRSLATEIANSTISPSLTGVTVHEGEIFIDFDADLSGAEQTTLDGLVAAHDGQDPPSNAVQDFVDANAIVTDPLTGVEGQFTLMQTLVNRRELFNDMENPLYDGSVTPILGSGGWGEDHASRISNLDEIHSPGGWHYEQIRAGLYRRPTDLLIYYGWLNSFNSAVNGWSNEAVAQDMAKFGLIVLPDGVQDPGHGDYANTQVIIPRIKELNPSALLFGYVEMNQAYGTLTPKIDQWITLGVDGIFYDQAGYDFGTDRAGQNQRMQYAKDNDLLCFVNSWNIDHVIGTENDPSYPNSTFNPSAVESVLGSDDYYLLESFPVNTLSYSSPGINAHTDWSYRAVKAITHRFNYGIKIAAVSVINNDNVNGQDLFEFSFVSALMFALDGHGTSDHNYGASTAQVEYWTRPDVSKLGMIFSLSPTVQAVVGDDDKYLRYLQTGRLVLDYGAGVSGGSIEEN